MNVLTNMPLLVTTFSEAHSSNVIFDQYTCVSQLVQILLHLFLTTLKVFSAPLKLWKPHIICRLFYKELRRAGRSNHACNTKIDRCSPW